MPTTSSALLKTILHKSLAEGVYRDVTSNTSQYYYILGKTLEWDDESAPPAPFDSYNYERAVRNEIITTKRIGASDVSFVIPRINWVSGEIYDMYDDQYTTKIIGLNVIDGGTGFTSLPTITVTGGGGTGAKFYPIVLDGQIIGIEDNDELKASGISDASNGYGYTSVPTVTVTGGGGIGAVIEAVVNIAPSGTQKLEDCLFYVMTEDFNVYKCLDNNNNAQSLNKPLGTSVDPISTDDGYIWKYMYTVPINLRSKFLSDEYIPVISALTNQFYSNGSVDTLIINNKGSDYTYANITVTGDGYVESDPTLLTAVSITNGGTGYVSPTVTFSDPVSDANAFSASAGVYLGQKIKNSVNDFYQVAAPGTLGTSEPTHRYGTVLNGTAGLKYLGTTVTGTANLTGDEITSVTLDGAVYDVEITNGGTGYTTVPSVTFSGGGGSGAEGVVTMYQDSVVYVTVTNPGEFNYTSEPTLVIGDQWTGSTAVYVGEQLFYGVNLYTVTANGTTHASTAPTHTSGSASNGTATLEYAGQRATGTVSLRYGAGYDAAPSISFEDSSLGAGAEASWLTTKSNAKLLPIIDAGQIVGVIVKEAGVGYSAATVAVSGDGDNAEIVADLSVGAIQTLQANNEILVESGTINAIKVISGGYGYGVATIEVQGDGTGCTAEAVLDSSSGKISKVTITNPGSGYTYANIVVTGNGHAASLRAVISPYGGHGKNSPDELFSTTLMFYSNLSTDLNQGLAVNNDYRQIGIIKNPRKYSDTARFTNQIGSACFLVQGSINTSHFPRDTDVRVTRVVGGDSFEKLYRVVTSTSSAVLLQSLQNDTPLVNDSFTNDDGNVFSVTTVSNPTVDKYSGQLMFIDNKAGFTPSTDETVTLRTVIKF